MLSLRQPELAAPGAESCLCPNELSFGVGVDEPREEVIEDRCVEGHRDDQVCGEGQRVDTEPERIGAHLTFAEPVGEVGGKGPRLVVDRPAPVALRLAEEALLTFLWVPVHDR